MKRPINIGYEAKRIFHNKTGLGNYGRDLIRILNNFYPENNYFLYNPKTKKKTLFQVDSNNIYERLPISKWNIYFKNYWRQIAVINNIKKDKIDLFHGLSGELPFGLRKNNIKSVVTIHDLIFIRYPQFYLWSDRLVYKFKFKNAAQQANHIIAITEQTKNDIVDFLGINPEKITVLYQGCNNAFKQDYPEIKKATLIEKLNLPEKFVLNVGTIEERKNIFEVVKAINGTNIPLIIVGRKTKYFEQIQTYIEQNNMQSQVRFFNGLTLEELAILYQLATIFVYPSLFEGFGIPIIEALYSRTPVITTTGGCFAEAGGPNSIYINPTKTAEIKTEIQLLWNNDAQRKEMSEKGFLFVQQFNNEVIAKKMNDLYLKILNEN
jgi:glycosyltransferase involved in cell wall biosynthesis